MFSALQPVAVGQKLIEYQSGMGSRDPNDDNVWILYNGVVAKHEGMILEADSAHFNVEENSLAAFRHVVITLTDTTFIYGRRLFYDGNTRVLNIWDDTVRLKDGATLLKANHLTYERDDALAYYDKWGHAVSRGRTLDSKQGYYNSDVKEFYIYDSVKLADSSMLLLTEFLKYNTETEVAHFETPTYIYSDSSTIYSELGEYNTNTRFAISFEKSHVDNQGRTIDSDTLYYDEQLDYGRAMGNVVIVDSTNNITCTGRYGETNQVENYSFVTDSAHVLFVDNGDSVFMHADTIYITVDDSNQLHTVRAHRHVRLFRRDAQAVCDSAFYNATDSLVSLFRNPVLWYEHYQCTADTIELRHDSAGARCAWLRSNCFAIQQVDREKFNQLKGRQGIVNFDNGEPLYADILGNAEMVYYLTEEDDSNGVALLGTNVGRGTDIRIYFDTNRAPVRVVTRDKPEMETYPIGKLPDEWKRLSGFQWQSEIRPRKPEDVFLW